LDRTTLPTVHRMAAGARLFGNSLAECHVSAGLCSHNNSRRGKKHYYQHDLAGYEHSSELSSSHTVRQITGAEQCTAAFARRIRQIKQGWNDTVPLAFPAPGTRQNRGRIGGAVASEIGMGGFAHILIATDLTDRSERWKGPPGLAGTGLQRGLPSSTSLLPGRAGSSPRSIKMQPKSSSQARLPSSLR